MSSFTVLQSVADSIDLAYSAPARSDVGLHKYLRDITASGRSPRAAPLTQTLHSPITSRLLLSDNIPDPTIIFYF